MTELERKALLPAGLRDVLPPFAAFEASEHGWLGPWAMVRDPCLAVAGVSSLLPSLLVNSSLRVRPEMNSLISKSCDPSGEALDACDHEPGLGAGDGGLEVLGETAVAPQPSKGALHHDAAGKVGEDRCESGQPWPVRHISIGRGCRPKKLVPENLEPY